jgi:hypothetical protein
MGTGSLRSRTAAAASRHRPVRWLVFSPDARWLRELALAVLLLGVTVLVARTAPWANAGQQRHFGTAALGASAVVMLGASLRAGFVKRDLLAAPWAYLCFMFFAAGVAVGIGGAPDRWLTSGSLLTWLVLGLFALLALSGFWWLHTAPATVALSLDHREKLVRLVISLPASYLVGADPYHLLGAVPLALLLAVASALLARGFGYAVKRLASGSMQADDIVNFFTVYAGLLLATRRWRGVHHSGWRALLAEALVLVLALAIVKLPKWLLDRWPIGRRSGSSAGPSDKSVDSSAPRSNPTVVPDQVRGQTTTAPAPEQAVDPSVPANHARLAATGSAAAPNGTTAAKTLTCQPRHSNDSVGRSPSTAGPNMATG